MNNINSDKINNNVSNNRYSSSDAAYSSDSYSMEEKSIPNNTKYQSINTKKQSNNTKNTPQFDGDSEPKYIQKYQTRNNPLTFSMPSVGDFNYGGIAGEIYVFICVDDDDV